VAFAAASDAAPEQVAAGSSAAEEHTEGEGVSIDGPEAETEAAADQADGRTNPMTFLTPLLLPKCARCLPKQQAVPHQG
jgi:hypothetical protein